jgi:hypothetical protein
LRQLFFSALDNLSCAQDYFPAMRGWNKSPTPVSAFRGGYRRCRILGPAPLEHANDLVRVGRIDALKSMAGA